MTTEVAPIPSATGVDWRAELAGAAMLLKSGLAPQSLKTPEAALFVILAGRDLGLSPTQALRSVNVIQGKVEVAADMQLALFKRSGGRGEWETLTDTAAMLVLTHPNGDKHRESFTMEDAKRAGLGGPNWAKFPKAMLRSRCITAAMKSAGFDVLAGVYAPGEVGGPEDAPEPVEAPTEPPKQLAAPSRPESRAVVTEDATVVDSETGEVLATADDALDAALTFPLPFGKTKKGEALGDLETTDLEGALTWARADKSRQAKYADFIACAVLVLTTRKGDVGTVIPGEAPEGVPDVPAKKPERVRVEDSGGIGAPDDNLLPF